MIYRVEVSQDAREQIAEMTRWWGENLPAKAEVFETELLRAEALLSRHPEAGAPYSRRAGVRRTLLRRTQIYLYYRLFPEERRVVVVAARHTARGRPPRL